MTIDELLARDVPPPDLVIYLQAPVTTLIDRVHKRGVGFERVEPREARALGQELRLVVVDSQVRSALDHRRQSRSERRVALSRPADDRTLPDCDIRWRTALQAKRRA